MRDPINPADIRVGDRVERVYVSGDHETIERFTVESVAHRAVSSCRLSWSIDSPRVGTVEWFLLDRPDPLAEIVEVMAPALMVADLGPDAPAWDRVRDEARDDWRRMAREALAAITERWELVEREKS